ncbi:MAG TPA: hypothetical protein VH877_05290 [Polyangia bacterium]|nr:hypothetical protein [Polyangia bacterium]
MRQIESVILGLEPDYDPVLRTMSGRMLTATELVSQALGRAGQLVATTFKRAGGEADRVESARDVLRRLVSYIESQPDGARIRQTLIGRQSTSKAVRVRSSKLLGVLSHALTVLDKERESLPEAMQRMAEVKAAHMALEALDRQVREARAGRRQMTPEVQAARANWLTVYAALKLLVESVLRLRGQTERMSEIFDDLAEIHRAPEVSDEGAPSKPPTTPPATPPTSQASAPTAAAAPVAPVAPAAPAEALAATSATSATPA